jgi:hypothetical protein
MVCLMPLFVTSCATNSAHHIDKNVRCSESKTCDYAPEDSSEQFNADMPISESSPCSGPKPCGYYADANSMHGPLVIVPTFAAMSDAPKSKIYTYLVFDQTVPLIARMDTIAGVMCSLGNVSNVNNWAQSPNSVPLIIPVAEPSHAMVEADPTTGQVRRFVLSGYAYGEAAQLLIIFGSDDGHPLKMGHVYFIISIYRASDTPISVLRSTATVIDIGRFDPYEGTAMQAIARQLATWRTPSSIDFLPLQTAATIEALGNGLLTLIIPRAEAADNEPICLHQAS